jgi:hypothetical protein
MRDHQTQIDRLYSALREGLVTDSQSFRAQLAEATTLQRRLLDAPKPIKRRYLRGLVSEIILNREKAIITGPSSAIAATVTSGDFDGPVLTSVREWRNGRSDSSGSSKSLPRLPLPRVPLPMESCLTESALEAFSGRS